MALIRKTVVAGAVLVSMALGSAGAQVSDPRNPFYQVEPVIDRWVVSKPSSRIETGHFSRLSAIQRTRALEHAASTTPTLQASMGVTETVRLIGLRSGALDGRRLLCGTVRTRDGAQTRFIARPGVATLESEVPSAIFQQGWRAIGCG